MKDDQQHLEQQKSELAKEKEQTYSRLQEVEISLEASERNATEALNAAHERLSTVESELRSTMLQYEKAIGARDEILRPVMIQRARGQVHDLGTGTGQLRRTVLVREPQQRVGIGNVQVGAAQGHAKRRAQSLQEGGARDGGPCVADAAQQCYAVRARHAAPGPLHELALHPAAYAPLVRGPTWRVAFGDEHVTVG